MKGKGKFKDATIDKLQNNYGMTTRSNVNNIKLMKKAVAVACFHVGASAEAEHLYHEHCPDGETSWRG